MKAIGLLDRRLFVRGAVATLATAPAVLRGAAQPAPLAETEQGVLRGLHSAGVLVFRGIPYGGPVSGAARRFRSAPPPPKWRGVRDASRFGARSIQQSGLPLRPGEPAAAEDCLFLNIWTPALDGKPRPVMVYYHGGGFMIGSGAAAWQDGSHLARDHDVVVVESNHRLGIFGYLYLGGLLGDAFRGNQGLDDLVLVLRWVQRNIASFGGDPDNVTIFGESGGGGKTASLYAMPDAAPYFHKASIESPIGPGHMTPDEATEVTRTVMRRLDLTDARQLLHVPASALLKAQMGSAVSMQPGTRVPGQTIAAEPPIMFWPFVDGHMLPEEPFARIAPPVSALKPLIIGGCKDEAVFFHRLDPSAFMLDEAGMEARVHALLGDRAAAWVAAFRKSRPQASPSALFMAIATAAPWRAHAIRIAEAKAKEGKAPVYAYLLDYPDPTPVPGTRYPQGSPHASDIAMKFDTVADLGVTAPAQLQTARNMSEMWATFARTGKPAARGQAAWPVYTLSQRETMIIDSSCRVEADPESAERRFFMGEAGVDDIR